MKQRWLYVLLVLSLAVNAGVLGFYGVRKYRDWRHFQQYASKWLMPGTSPRQLDRLFDELERTRAPYFDTLRTATRELGMLALEPSPDSGRLDVVLDRIARATRQNTRFVRNYSRAWKRLYRPEKFEFWRNRMKAEYDSILRADSGTAVQPEEER